MCSTGEVRLRLWLLADAVNAQMTSTIATPRRARSALRAPTEADATAALSTLRLLSLTRKLDARSSFTGLTK